MCGSAHLNHSIERQRQEDLLRVCGQISLHRKLQINQSYTMRLSQCPYTATIKYNQSCPKGKYFVSSETSSLSSGRMYRFRNQSDYSEGEFMKNCVSKILSTN